MGPSAHLMPLASLTAEHWVLEQCFSCSKPLKTRPLGFEHCYNSQWLAEHQTFGLEHRFISSGLAEYQTVGLEKHFISSALAEKQTVGFGTVFYLQKASCIPDRWFRTAFKSPQG